MLMGSGVFRIILGARFVGELAVEERRMQFLILSCGSQTQLDLKAY